MEKKPATEGGRRTPLNMKTTPQLRDAIKLQAKASGRTMSHQVEYIIERALITEANYIDLFGGRETFELLLSLASGIKALEAKAGHRWFDEAGDDLDGKIADALLSRISSQRVWFLPPSTDQEEAELEAAAQAALDSGEVREV